MEIIRLVTHFQRFRCRNVALLAALPLLVSVATYAASLSPADRDSIEQQQRQILQQNQQQRQELERSTPLTSAPQISPQPGGPCFDMHSITLLGADYLPTGEQQKLIQPYLQKCLGNGQINALVKQVSDWYIGQGFITSRAFLTEQDLSSGTTSRVLEVT
ncbi:POTRA domain-containing protein [Rahnella sp. PCH160]|uniref:POTRA domain-containing protein n=1 Tax=Rahnella sp. PCH160 TaxID=3447928 RepID=UPI0039FCCAC1